MATRHRRAGGYISQAIDFETLSLFGARPAMRQKDLGIWQTWTWAEVLDIVRAYAVGLNRLGLKRGETIAIVGANRPKLYWSVMAAQMLGAIPVPVYADAVADELAFVLAHAEVRFAAVEDQEQIDKIMSVIDRLPKLEQMVYDERRGLRDYDHSHLHPMDDVIAEGRKALADDPTVGAWLDAEIAAGKGSDPSIILYTSGTTGTSKGVVLTGERSIKAATDTVTVRQPDRERRRARLSAARLGRRSLSQLCARAWLPASAWPARKTPTRRWPTCARSGRAFISRRRARSKCCSRAS